MKNPDKIKILLIEDDPEEELLIRQFLAEDTDHSYVVEKAEQLSTGLERLKRNNIDIILLDLSLSGSLGMDTFMRIRLQTPDLPLVVLTGYDNREMAARVLQENGQDYVLKDKLTTRGLTRSILYAIERFQMQKALLHSESRFRKIIEYSPDGVVVTDPDSIIKYLNPVAEKIFGSTVKEMSGRPFRFPILTGNAAELEITRPDQIKMIVEMRAEETIWEEKDAYIITLRDITRRKQTEEALQESEERYRTLFKDATDGIVLSEADTGTLIECNEAFCRMVEREKDELLGQNQSILHSSQELVNGLGSGYPQRKLADSGKIVEDTLLSKSGKIIPVEIRATRIRMKNTDYLLGIFRDNTERRLAEETIRASLLEKEALIKELYHRTYNNMQVISSMLNVQTSYIEDEKAKNVFREMADRINSMAKVHQILYQSKDLSGVNLKEYITEISGLLIQSYTGPAKNITLSLELEEEKVLIDTAVPCGLIINELITNALKYAFPGGRKGLLKISLRRIDNDNLELRVSDNGIGVPKDFDFKTNRGMGLQIIYDIAEKQLAGKVSFESRGGVAAVIRFKDKLYHKRV